MNQYKKMTALHDDKQHTVEPHLKTTSYIRPPLIKTDFWRSRRIFSLFHIRPTSPNRPPLSDHFRPLCVVPMSLIYHDSTSLSDQLMLYFSISRAVFFGNPTCVYIDGWPLGNQRSSGGSHWSQPTTTYCPHCQTYRAFNSSLEAFPYKTSDVMSRDPRKT